MCDVGNQAIEAMLKKLKSRYYHSSGIRPCTLLSWGFVTIEKGREPIKNAGYPPPLPRKYALYLQYHPNDHVVSDSAMVTPITPSVWIVLKIPFGTLQISSEVTKHPKFMYIAYNVGREGWSVITTDFHILTHVLENNNIITHYLSSQRRCSETCKHKCYDLVPLVKPLRTPMYYSSSLICTPEMVRYYTPTNFQICRAYMCYQNIKSGFWILIMCEHWP